MSDYKVGDNVLIKAKIVSVDEESLTYEVEIDNDPVLISPSFLYVNESDIFDKQPPKTKSNTCEG